MITAARSQLVGLLSIVAMAWFAIAASAQGTPPAGAPADPREAEAVAAIEAARAASRLGPEVIPLIDQGQLRLPDGYVYVPAAEAGRLMRALGNNTGPNLLGMVISAQDGMSWFSLLTYNRAGYIKDDDAKDWKADELLQQLRDGTEAGNEQRAARGFPAIEVAGWIERPTYAAETHRLVWSALVRDKGAPAGGSASVNYNTYALGREGYMQLNLVTSSSSIEGHKPHAHTLLGALDYLAGKRYEDFDPSKDRIAEYGLAALVAGAAAKKLGFFAALLAILLKSWKLVALGLFGVVALFGKLFKRRSA